MILSSTAFNKTIILSFVVKVSLIAFCCSSLDMMDLVNRLVANELKLCWSRVVKASNRVLNALTAREESIVEGSLVEGMSAQVAELEKKTLSNE